MSAGRSCVIPATPLVKILPCLGSAAADNSLGLLCSLRLSPVPPPVRGFFFAVSWAALLLLVYFAFQAIALGYQVPHRAFHGL